MNCIHTLHNLRTLTLPVLFDSACMSCHCTTCTFPSNAHDVCTLIIPVFIIIVHDSDDQQLRSRFEMLTRPAKEALVVRLSMYNTPKATRSTLAQLMTQFQVLHVHLVKYGIFWNYSVRIDQHNTCFSILFDFQVYGPVRRVSPTHVSSQKEFVDNSIENFQNLNIQVLELIVV